MPLFDRLAERAEKPEKFLAGLTKQRSVSGWLSTAGLVVIGLPLWAAITVPAAILSLIVRPFFNGKKMKSNILSELPSGNAAPPPPLADRPIDVVVLGATGLTGGYLVAYLSKYHPDLNVALAGRNLAKLEKVRDAHGTADQQLIVADAGDIDSLFAMCHQAKVVASTVGPFKRYGNLVYHACAHSGTHYADITGEGDWVQHMGKLYGPVAESTGASLVSCCGVDSVPSDLGAFLACTAFEKEHGSRARGVETVVTRFKGGMPGGTLETVAGLADGTDRLQKAPAGTVKASGDKKGGQAAGARTAIVGLFTPLKRSSIFKQWTSPFFMAPTNTQVVRRTNRLLGYAPNLTYQERWGFVDFPSALSITLGLYMMAAPWILLSPLRAVLRALGALPKKGSGASAMSENICARGSVSFLVGAYGTGADGNPAATTLRFSGLGDPGVGHTAVCQGEVAALLARGESRPGAVTPVAAVGGEKLAQALKDTGLVFVDDAPTELVR